VALASDRAWPLARTSCDYAAVRPASCQVRLGCIGSGLRIGGSGSARAMPVACLLRPGHVAERSPASAYPNGLGARLIYPCHISRRSGVMRMRRVTQPM
jgi:hypothetical protein